MRTLLTKKQVAERLGYHPEHVMRLSREGKFPRPVKFGASPGCAVRFDAAEVEQWIDDYARARAARVSGILCKGEL